MQDWTKLLAAATTEKYLNQEMSPNLNERKLTSSQHKTEDKNPKVFEKFCQQKPVTKNSHKNGQQYRHCCFSLVFVSMKKKTKHYHNKTKEEEIMKKEI